MGAIIKNRICFLITTAVCSIFYATSAEASADTYLGCYLEHGTDSVFVIPTSNAISSSTPDGCRENCRKDVIYSFAGLWGGTHCYCASGLNDERIKPVNNSRCNSPCPGNPAEFCGGSKDLYIFSVHSVCPRGSYGRNCTDKCNCKDNKNCTVYGMCPGYECAAGWRLNSTIPNKERCSIDVDECKAVCNSTNTSSTNCHKCGSEHPCINTQGSFTCNCSKGFEFDTKEFCKDVNECEKQTGNCSAGATCINTEGSYRCEDIDECETNTSDCNEHKCINVDGGYYCVCQSGYKLQNDRHSCFDVDECQNSCSSLNTTNCHQCKQSYECQNTIGNYTCSCKSGFIVNTHQDTCEDIDECSQQMANCSQTCTNTIGSYKCGCLEGFELEDDGHRCVDIDECSRKMDNCSHTCTNTNGSYLCGCSEGLELAGDNHHCVLVERGWWLLVAGLGLGIGVLVIIIVALAITVCKLLARRHFNTTASASPTGYRSLDNLFDTTWRL